MNKEIDFKAHFPRGLEALCSNTLLYMQPICNYLPILGEGKPYYRKRGAGICHIQNVVESLAGA
jgi:hypothetical protein